MCAYVCSSSGTPAGTLVLLLLLLMMLILLMLSGDGTATTISNTASFLQYVGC